MNEEDESNQFLDLGEVAAAAAGNKIWVRRRRYDFLFFLSLL